MAKDEIFGEQATADERFSEQTAADEIFKKENGKRQNMYLGVAKDEVSGRKVAKHGISTRKWQKIEHLAGKQQ